MTGSVLVTGGAGYVGSHACSRLAAAGFVPVVYDNLSTGHADFVRWGPIERGDIRDHRRLDQVFAAHKPMGVLHFAGLTNVEDSTRDPARFYDMNVGGSLCLMGAARRAGVELLVFSSSCAIYGESHELLITEEDTPRPLNAYARSKLMIEQMLFDHCLAYGMRHATLRYFNAAGAHPEEPIGERHEPETHAVPRAIFAALGRSSHFAINGDDYATRDGTTIRDYTHVLDLADAHVLALKHLLAGGKSEAFNLGTGRGTTVAELVATVRRISGRALPIRYQQRRVGDAASLVADSRKAANVLGWNPIYGLDDIVLTAWNWHSKVD